MKIIACSLFWTAIVVANSLGTQTEFNASQLSSKITKGDPADSNVTLYMASLQLDGKHICSASMFEIGFLLSSANCVRYIRGQRHILKDTAVIGSSCLLEGVRYDIIDLIVHPQFNFSSAPPKHGNFDVGVVMIKITEHLSKLPLAPLYKRKYDVRSQSLGSLCGWGSTNVEHPDGYESAKNSRILHCLKIDIYGRNHCHLRIRGIDFKRKHLCGSGKEPNQGISLGDTGSPLTLRVGQPVMPKVSKNYIIGITSGQIETPEGYLIHFVRTALLFEDIYKMKEILEFRIAKKAEIANKSEKTSTEESNKRVKLS